MKTLIQPSRRLFVVCGLLLLATTAPLWAQENDPGQAPSVVEDPEALLPIGGAEPEGDGASAQPDDGDQGVDINAFGLTGLLQVLLSLGLVVALIYAIYFLLKRSRKTGPEDSDILKVYESRALGGKTWIHIFETGNKVFVVAANDSSIESLGTVDDQFSIDEMRLLHSQQRATKRSFNDVVGDFFSGQRKERQNAQGTEVQLQRLREAQQRLRSQDDGGQE